MVTRRFSLENDFMNYKSDDLLYGFMRNISTSKDGLEYLPLKNFQKVKKVIAGLCGYSVRQINNKILKLKEVGLIKETEIGVNTQSYIFPYDYAGSYKIINKDMLSYLINTRNSNVIRIYLYLLNKYEWKKGEYLFTVGELKRALGYSDFTKTADSMIRDVLTSLKKEGIIKFEKVWCEEVNEQGKPFPVERSLLTFVAKTKGEFLN